MDSCVCPGGWKLWNESCNQRPCGDCRDSPQKRLGCNFRTTHQRGHAECPRPSSRSRSKNYSSWCLRGWLLCKLAGLDFDEEVVSLDDPVRARRAAAAVAVVPGAVPHARRRQGVGHAGHRRVPGRDLPAGRPAAEGPRRARPLPRDLRRDALGLLQSALGAADEPQGAPSGLQGVGRRAGRHRARRRRSGASAWSAYGGPYLFGAA